MREEIFGPVIAIATFSTGSEVLPFPNQISYVLAAVVYTNDYGRVIHMTNALGAGTSWVNTCNFVHWSVPFGG